MPRPPLPHNVAEAVRLMVMDYGVERLAAKTGQSAGVIYNKINTSETSHHIPTIADFMVWQQLTLDHRPLHAGAHALGEVCYAVPNLTFVSDQALLELVLRIGQEQGALCTAINDALADRRFTQAEFERVKAEAYQVIGAVAETLARIEGLVDG